MAIITLDHVKNIQLDKNNSPLDNYQALDYLRLGLHAMAYTVREEEVRLYLSKISLNLLNSSGRAAERDAIFTCYFNWFSTSIVNYVRLVGLIDIMIQKGWVSSDIKYTKNGEAVKKHCVKYVKEVIPEIRRWRNKIAAHFAITDPDKEDNLGTLEYSIMNPICYKKPYFRMGAFSWSKSGEQSNLTEWALTETFEKLGPRFWPEAKLPELSGT